jgi:hypothetical protein
MEYYYSQKGEEMYKAIDRPYPLHSFDVAYNTFMRKTKNSKDNETIITKMIRLKLPSEENQDDELEGKEYILYDVRETRRDGLGNKKTYVRLNLGKYPIPEKILEMKFDEDFQPVQKVVGVGEVHTGYEIPFTKERAEEMHKLCKDKITATNSIRTQYLVQKYNEYKISVDSFKDWLTGDFETLYATGNARGEEKPVVKPKTKKSKEREQAEFQKEIFRKSYTVKPKEENNNNEDKVMTTATEASVV